MAEAELLRIFEDWLSYFQFCRGEVNTLQNSNQRDIEDLIGHANIIHTFLLDMSSRPKRNLRMANTHSDKLDSPRDGIGKTEIEMNPTMRRDCPELIYIDTNFLHDEQEPLKIEEVVRKPRRSSYSRGKYNKYTEAQKHSAVAMLEEGRKLTDISKELGIPAKNIRRWKEEGINRKVGAGRRIKDIDMELNLRRWLIGEWNSGRYPSCKEIKQMAKTLSTNIEFRASKGWLQKFVDRTRRITKEQPI